MTIKREERGKDVLEETAALDCFEMGCLVHFAKMAVIGARLDLRAKGDDVKA